MGSLINIDRNNFFSGLSIRSFALAMVVGVGLGPATSPGAVINVTTTVDPATGSNGLCSLREAIQAANADTTVNSCSAGSGADTINLPNGTYQLTISNGSELGENDAVLGDLDISAELAIVGAGAAVTIVDGGALDRVFDIRPGVTATISGVTVQNGWPTSDLSGDNEGGGIRNCGGVLTVVASAITGNLVRLARGGGIANGGGGCPAGGWLDVIDSTVSNNSIAPSGQGAGIFNDEGATLAVAASSIVNNVGTSDEAMVGGGPVYGGGVANCGVATIDATTIAGNAVVDPNRPLSNCDCVGAGVSSRICGASSVGDFRLTVRDSLIGGNFSGGAGGGIFATGADAVMISDSAILGNGASGFDPFDTPVGGGGIFLGSSSSGQIERSLIGSNEAFRGAGISTTSGVEVTIRNTTISGNRSLPDSSGVDGGGILVGQDLLGPPAQSIAIEHSTIAFNEPGGGILIGDPNLALDAFTLSRSIVAQNFVADLDGNGDIIPSTRVPQDIDGTVLSGGFNFIQSLASTVLTGDLTGVIVLRDPMLGPLADNLPAPPVGDPAGLQAVLQTHWLMVGSWAIDATDNTSCPGVDQRGQPRPVDGDDDDHDLCDIGAVEVNPLPEPDQLLMLGAGILTLLLLRRPWRPEARG